MTVFTIDKNNRDKMTTAALQSERKNISPQHVNYSALRLILATEVEPASLRDIEAVQYGDARQTTHKVSEDSVAMAKRGIGGLIRYKMPYGNEYLVPYANICGRILADTGSTVTLINEEFASWKGLNKYITDPPLLLRDVSNGEVILTDHCYLRLTVTTVRGERVTIVVLAHCTSNLSYDILLGTRDLEKYKISVVSHRGEAQIMVGDSTELIPMLDDIQISHLQYQLAKGRR